MFRLSCLVATSILALTVGAANATTFDVTGSASIPLSGMITISSSGVVSGIDVTVNFPPSTPLSPAFTVLDTFASPNPTCSGGFCDITIDQAPPGSGYDLLLILNVASLASYTGGAIYEDELYPGSGGPEGFVATCGVTSGAGACGELTAATTPPPTPLPAALPLFATGLGTLGLFGWRRKRKGAAAIAAA